MVKAVAKYDSAMENCKEKFEKEKQGDTLELNSVEEELAKDDRGTVKSVKWNATTMALTQDDAKAGKG